MKKTIKENYVYNLIYQVILILYSVITIPYLSRILGPNGSGIYSYTISIVTYFCLFGTLGMSLYGQREIAYIQDNKNKKSKLFTELLLIRFITMSISILLFYFFIINNSEYNIYFKILIINMLASYFDITWFYQGEENFKKIAIRNIVIKIISLISIFIFIKSSNHIGIYLFIYSITNLLANLSLWLNIRKHVSISFKNINLKKHLIPILLLFIPQIAVQVYTILDKTMIGLILNDMSEVGYYEQSEKVIKVLLTIITSLGTIMLPRIASCYSKNETVKIKKYISESYKFMFLLSFPMIFGIIVISTDFVPMFFGREFDKIKMLLPLLSIIILLIGSSNITGTGYLLAINKQNKYTLSVVCGAVINVILNLILISKYMSLGAVIATIIAELSVSIIQLYYVKETIKIKDILKSSINYFISSIIMLIICLIIKNILNPGVIRMFILVMSGVVTYIGILLILKDKFLKYIIKTVKDKVGI